MLAALPLLGLLLAQDPPPPPLAEKPPETPLENLVVLPVTVRVEDVRFAEASSLLTGLLTERLAEQGTWRVLGTEEVQELLKAEALRQGVGCTDDGCLAELAGALGARWMVSGEVIAAGGTYLWTASLINQQDATVKGRAAVKASSLQGLLAQVEEVALGLAGRGDETKLKGKAAMRRLGFTKKEDLAQFRTYREQHAEQSTSEALTQFIIDHNVESTRWAALEAGFAVGAGVLMVAALGTAIAGLTLISNLYVPGIATFFGLGTLGLGTAALALGATAAGLTVVDVLDRGRVPVRRSGCCRNDADIQDAEQRDGVQRALALAVVLSGPSTIFAAVMVAASVGYLVGSLYLVGQAKPLLGPASVPLWMATLVGMEFPVLVGAWLGSLCILPLPILVTPVLGLVQLLWPHKPAVEDAGEVAP